MASIIKSQLGVPHEPACVTKFNATDLREQALLELENAQKQALQIVEEAKAEARTIRENAKEEGCAEGRADMQSQVAELAQAMAEDECRKFLSSCEASLEELNRNTFEWLQQWRNQTVHLASKLAEKVVHQKVSEGHMEVLMGWLTDSIKMLSSDRHLRVRVHPSDFDVAGKALERIANLAPQASSAQVVTDPGIEPGGCVVDSDNGSIDQQISSQIQQLVSQLS